MAGLTEEQASLLKGKNFAVVGTVGKDGIPQLTINWIDWDGERVVFNIAEGRVKPANIRRNPVVSVCVYNHENPYQYLTVIGPPRSATRGRRSTSTSSHRYRRDYHYVDGEKRLIVRSRLTAFARGF